MIDRVHSNRVASSGRMKFIDQTPNSWCHDEEVACRSWMGVPVRMGHATRREHCRPSGSLDLLITELECQRPFQDIPCLIISMMDMERSNRAWWACWSTRIGPFRHHK